MAGSLGALFFMKRDHRFRRSLFFQLVPLTLSLSHQSSPLLALIAILVAISILVAVDGPYTVRVCVPVIVR
jgi:hypothetical protein